jgi:hypothetical protein
VELRAIANEIGEENRDLWRLDEALAALAAALPEVLASISSALTGTGRGGAP